VKRTIYLLLIVAAILGWRGWTTREIVRSPGVLVPEAPRQVATGDRGSFMRQGFRLTPRASFEIRARVLSREDYRWGAEADLSPLDLALGWGMMSDQAILDRIEISQGARWYYTRYEHPGPLTDAEIIRQSGNMHMVPANAAILDHLRKIRRGDVVRASGYLVDVRHESGFHCGTSLSREDTGNGSCELFYVERIEIEGRG
jgi:hypothetical protein